MTLSNSIAPMIFVLSTLPNLFLFDFYLISDKSSFHPSYHISLRNFPYNFSLGKFSLGNSKISTSSNSLAPMIFVLMTLPNLFLFDFYLISDKSSFHPSSHISLRKFPYNFSLGKFSLGNSKNSTSSNSLANSIFLLRTLPNLFLFDF